MVDVYISQYPHRMAVSRTAAGALDSKGQPTAGSVTTVHAAYPCRFDEEAVRIISRRIRVELGEPRLYLPMEDAADVPCALAPGDLITAVTDSRSAWTFDIGGGLTVLDVFNPGGEGDHLEATVQVAE